MNTETDTMLMRRFMLGEEPAFAELYRRRRRDVYLYAYSMCGLQSVAEDVTQDVFLSAYLNAKRFRESLGSVRAWLCGAARYQVLNRIRQQERVDLGLEDHVLLDGAPTVEENLENEQRLEPLRRAILALPMHYRDVVVLCELAEFSYVEAASTLGCPVGTVRSRLHRARALLVAELHPDTASSEAETPAQTRSRQ